MTADGVSLPTTIAQMGSVAKTQAKGQQSAQQVAPFADQLDKKEELRVQRVKETTKAEQEKIDPEKEKENDRRRRRRLKRNKKLVGSGTEEDQENQESTGEESDSENQEKVGLLIDLRA